MVSYFRRYNTTENPAATLKDARNLLISCCDKHKEPLGSFKIDRIQVLRIPAAAFMLETTLL